MEETQATSEHFILFRLGNTTYGVPSRVVKQMEMVEHITPVPDAPPFVKGVVLSRGRVVPTIDLRTRFGFEEAPYDLRTRLIIIRVGDRTVGLIVDTAREFIAIPTDVVQPPPDTISGVSGQFLEGIAALGERLVLLLDVDRVVNLAKAVTTANLESNELGQ